MKVKQFVKFLGNMPQDAPVMLFDEKYNATSDDEENGRGCYSDFDIIPHEFIKTATGDLVQGVAVSFNRKDDNDDLVACLMEAKILLNRVALALMVRPENEPDSEFADLIDSCEEMSSDISGLIEP